MSGDISNGPPSGDDDERGGGWPAEPAEGDELAAFLQGRIPAPQNGDYWQTIDDRLTSISDNADAPGRWSPDDEELTGFLQSSIPSPGPSFWEDNELRLTQIADQQGFSDSLDTAPGPVRLMAMHTTTSSPEIASVAQRRSTFPKGALVLAAAAALVLIAGVGIVALRGGSEGEGLELATRPEVSQPSTEDSAGSAAATEPDESDRPSGAVEAEVAPSLATSAGPLTTMQLHLVSDDNLGTEAVFCFAGDGVNIAPVEEPAQSAAVRLSVLSDGSYSLLALQNDFYLLSASGAGTDDGIFDTNPLGIANLSTLLPPYQIALTDRAISFGPESTLPVVACLEIEPEVRIMMDLVDASRNRYSTAVPAEGPLTAIQTRVNAPGVHGQSEAYCFTASGQSAVHLTVDTNGFIGFVGIESNGSTFSGSAAGTTGGQLEARVFENVNGSEAELPLSEVVVTDESFSLSGTTLNVVPCSQVAFLIDVALAAPAPAASELATELAPISEDEVISSAGLGAIRIGMLVSELESDLGVSLDILTIDGDEAGTCGVISSTIDRDLVVLVELTGDGDAIVQRISTQSARWATPSGTRVGATEQQLRDTFPDQLVEQEHAFVEDGAYLTFVPSDPNDPNTVQFVVERGFVTEIRAGSGPWVGLAEGCS